MYKSCVTFAMNYCLAFKLTWILFYHVYALKDESNNLLNGSSVSIGRTTNSHVNLSILKSNLPTLDYVFTSVNVTPKSKLTTSNVTVISEDMSTTKLSNSTKQLDKFLSEKTTEVRRITTGTHTIQEEEVAEIDEFEKNKLGESSIHSGDSHADLIEEPRRKDSEDSGPQIDPGQSIFDRKHPTESESKKSNGFIYQGDSGTVVHDKLYTPDISVSYVLVLCCILVVLILCIWKPLCHILYNIYGGCCSRSRVSRIDLNSKVAYRHLNTEEL
ncbi:unnamed protein product [Schistosoma guineensis]|nr:unnamed protein product [Schistosoma guineensis]